MSVQSFVRLVCWDPMSNQLYEAHVEVERKGFQDEVALLLPLPYRLVAMRISIRVVDA